MNPDQRASGKIDFLSIAETLKDLCLSRSSGELQLSRGTAEKKVFFKNGTIIFAASNLDEDRLGDTLVKHKVISRAQLDDAFSQGSSTGKKQGLILVQMGILSPKELFQGLNLQVRSIILSLFSWETGQYRFIDRLPPQGEIVALHIQPATLILEGVVTRAAKMAQFRDHWDPNRRKIGPHPDPPWIAEDLRLPQDARTILALVEKGTHWKKIPPLTGLSEENTSAFLYTLAILDLISAAPVLPEEKDATRPQTMKPSPTPDRSKIEELSGKLDKLNLYQVLRLQPGAGNEEIKASYLSMAKEFHPDRFIGNVYDDLRGNIDLIFMKINEAYTVLSNAGKREEYDRKEVRLEAASRPQADSDSDPQIARAQYRKGMLALKEDDAWSAIESFRWAVNLSPRNPTYHTWLGAALTRTKKRLHEAEEHCKTAIALDYSNPLYYVHLGQVYKTGRLYKKAKEQFEIALKLKPGYSQALQGLKNLEAT
jgi:tetratricopeptide (TPR) repeat protein